MLPSIWWEKHLLLPINLINLIQKYRFNIPPKTDMGCVCLGSNQRNLISIKAKKIGENFGNASATLITQRDTSCISIEEGVKTEIDVTHLASSVDGADHDEFLIKYKRT